MSAPCGQCIGCRLSRSRDWGLRCTHEAQMHPDNCFVTLTYNDENLPLGSTLVRDDIKKFFKRLLKKYEPTKIRRFYSGEYGDETNRPHYHACIFNYRPTDGVFYKKIDDYFLYTSETLNKIWGLGHVTFGELTYESACYTARYTLTKITGELAEDHYSTIDPETGEVTQRVPEFSGQSNRPGIGTPWLDKYAYDIFEKDEVILNGRPMKPPRFYTQYFEKLEPERIEEIKLERIQRSGQRRIDLGPDYNHSRRQFDGNKIANSRITQRNHIP